jgi:hypothetical protein
MAVNLEDFRSGAGATALWWGVLAGPIGFALDEVLSYAIVQHACSTGSHRLLHFYTVIAILFSLSGFAAAQWCYRHISQDMNGTNDSVLLRSRWMALYGIAASIAFAIVIIAVSIPKWTLSPCD